VQRQPCVTRGIATGPGLRNMIIEAKLSLRALTAAARRPCRALVRVYVQEISVLDKRMRSHTDEHHHQVAGWGGRLLTDVRANSTLGPSAHCNWADCCSSTARWCAVQGFVSAKARVGWPTPNLAARSLWLYGVARVGLHSPSRSICECLYYEYEH
jgi:hypothetical protein